MITRGAAKTLTKKEVNRILSVLCALTRSAKGRTEVTLTILMKRAKVKVSASTFKGELHKRNVKFRRMRVKPLLTIGDKNGTTTKPRRNHDETTTKPLVFYR